MSCCHYYEFTDTGDTVFSVDISSIKFGPGALEETGSDARELGLKRVGVFTDPVLAALPHVDVFASGHSLAALDDVLAAIAAP